MEKFNEHIEWEEDVPNMAYDENSLSAGIDGSGIFTSTLNGNVYLIRNKICYINGRVSSEEEIPKEVIDEYNRCIEWLKTQK